MLLEAATKQRRTAEAYLFVATIIWGGTFVVVKAALSDVSPLFFLGTRFLLAALILTPFVVSRQAEFTSNALRAGILLGIFLFIGFATQTIGLKYTTASKSGFITGLLVVFTPLLQLLIEKRMPRPGNLIGIVFVVAGLYFLTSPRGSEFNIGDGLTLACAFFFALYIVYLDVYSKMYNILVLTYIQIAAVAILSFSGAFTTETMYINFTGNLVFALLYTGLLATLLTTYLQTRYQQHTTPTRAAIIFALEPVISAILAFLILSEILGTVGILGGAAIVAGLIISELSDEFERWGFRFKASKNDVTEV